MPDLKTADFDFNLPTDRIAQTAMEPRDHARLLRVTPNALADHHVYDLPALLGVGDLLVMNDTRVIPARLFGKRGEVKVETLLHKRQSAYEWLAFARPGKRLSVGDMIVFAPDFVAEILEKQESGEVLLRFYTVESSLVPIGGDLEKDEPALTSLLVKSVCGTPLSLALSLNGRDGPSAALCSDKQLFALLHRYGEPPLPPYIKRASGTAKNDQERYQTVYAAREGAVAAPTAGLHFTPDLLAKLAARGVEQVKVTLHVGAGTFLPVKVENIKDHVMHTEWGNVSVAAAEVINKARREKRRVIAVGTTSLRVVESASDENGVVHPFSQDTSIFITPGYRFRAIDALLTNFHLPQSTLFMLVSAFMGLEKMQTAYAYAIDNNYRFYSYGDACLLEKE